MEIRQKDSEIGIFFLLKIDMYSVFCCFCLLLQTEDIRNLHEAESNQQFVEKHLIP